MLDARGKRVIVFGGGEVGLRKALFFAREADVTVVSRTFVPGFGSVEKEVKRIESEIGTEQEALIDVSDFVIIATGDRELNDRLEARAIGSGKFCNRADGISSFLIPSVVERRNFLVAISTMGRSPAMSRYLRREVEANLGAEMSLMIDLQEELRKKARCLIPGQLERERFLWNVLGDESIWEALGHDPDQAKIIAFRKLEAERADHI
ncbi:MAG TPA: bifunctional precorrin-2 dehydrogenase/sirohydrochlorin ferrochelatase [Methanomassiliicoccales archaeon]|jgi:siroheme synthase-like protein